MDQRQWRRKDAVDLKQMEHNQKPKGMLRKEEDLQWQLYLKRRSLKILQMKNKHLQQKEEEADLKGPRKRWQLLKQRVLKEKVGVVVGLVKMPLQLKKMKLILKKNLKMRKKKIALTSKHICFSHNSLLV